MALASIKLGNYDVLESGSLIVVKNQPIKFQVATGIALIVNFYEDKSKPENHTDYRNIDSSTLEYNFYNLNAPLSWGFTEFWLIGTLNKRNVYFNYRVIYSKGADLAPVFHYTFCLGEEAKNA